MDVAGGDWIDEVLRFWFDTLRPTDWWRGDPRVDETIRSRFATRVAAMSAAPPEQARLDARGHLAAVVVFDQFPRHLHRGSALAFATDALARTFTVDAIDRGLDLELGTHERHVLYMPLMHGEDAHWQAQSLAMFGHLGDHGALRSAVAHERTIARFGRFPQRNAALGRTSTADEVAFLDRKPGRG